MSKISREEVNKAYELVLFVFDRGVSWENFTTMFVEADDEYSTQEILYARFMAASMMNLGIRTLSSAQLDGLTAAWNSTTLISVREAHLEG